MKKNSLTLLKLIILVLANLQTLTQCYPSTEFIEATCLRTPYPKVCIKVIESDPRSSGANILALAKIMVDQVEHNCRRGAWQVRHFFNSATDPEMNVALRLCSYFYIEMLKAAGVSKEALIQLNPGFVEESMTTVVKESQWCETGFAEGLSPLTLVNTRGKKLAAVTKAIAQMML